MSPSASHSQSNDATRREEPFDNWSLRAGEADREGAFHTVKQFKSSDTMSDVQASGAESAPNQASTSQQAASAGPKKQRAPHHKKDPRSQSPSVQVSRGLSYLLRHGADKEKLSMGSDGYVALDEVLKKTRIKQIDMEPDNGQFTKDGKKKRREPTVQDVLDLIANPGEKSRFEVKEDATTQKWLIRAIQGHTIQSVTELDHTPITLSNLSVLDYRGAAGDGEKGQQGDVAAVEASDEPVLPPGVEILHGTTPAAWDKIKESGGLSKMQRNHIHLARGKPGTPGVGSGSRISSPLLIHIDLIAALRDGVAFDLASNGAVLTAGVDGQGVLPLKYVTRVEDRQGQAIWQSGNP
ncbi:unnamed protein product [Parajaminaea phylloscopi]